MLGYMWNLLEHMLCKLANPLTKRTSVDTLFCNPHLTSHEG